MCGLAFLPDWTGPTVPILPIGVRFSCVFFAFWQVLSLCLRSGGWRCGGLWISVDFCRYSRSSLRSNRGSFTARRSLWAAARVSLPLQWHHALLWLTADKVRSRCRSHNSQVWLKKTVSTCIRLWSLCRCRCHWSAWKKRKKKPHKHNRACGYWPHLSMLTLAADLVTFETISRDHIMLLMHLFQAACGEPGSGVEP